MKELKKEKWKRLGQRRQAFLGKQKRVPFTLSCFFEKDLEPLAAGTGQKSGSGSVRGDKLFWENRRGLPFILSCFLEKDLEPLAARTRHTRR
jgi:hypothetical protein